MNQIIFQFVNLAELWTLYIVWREMVKTQHNQMNIKYEIRLITIAWLGGSFIYLVSEFSSAPTNPGTHFNKNLEYVAVIGI